MTVLEVFMGKEKLRYRVALLCEQGIVGIHENRLPYGRRRLELGNRGRSFLEAKTHRTRAYRTRGHDNDPYALPMEDRKITKLPRDHGQVEHATLVEKR